VLIDAALLEPSSALHPVVILVTAAASVALLHGAALHSDVTQLLTGSTMLELACNTAPSPSSAETLRQAPASGFAATCVKAVSQLFEIENAETPIEARRAET